MGWRWGRVGVGTGWGRDGCVGEGYFHICERCTYLWRMKAHHGVNVVFFADMHTFHVSLLLLKI
jgi:hypothetical protein